MSYVAGPIAGVFATLGFALTAFAAGSGRGWGLSPYSAHAVKFFFGCEFLGAILGAMIGLIGGLYRRGQAEGRHARKAGCDPSRPAGRNEP